MRRRVVKTEATCSGELRRGVDATRNRNATRRDARCRPWLERLESRVTPALAFNLSSLPMGVVGVAYPNGPGQPVQFSVQGGTGNYTYSLGDKVLNNDNTDNQYALIDATLPAGMTFINGALGGTPQQAGVFTIVVQASDSSGVEVSEAYSLTINALSGNPNTITLATGNTDPTTFAAGTVGTPYTAGTITGSGGTGSYTFAVTAGQLPPGLQLTQAGTSSATAMLEGTPAAWGDYAFTVTATDGNQYSGNQAYAFSVGSPVSFNINGAAAPITPYSTNNTLAIVGVPLTLPVVAGNSAVYNYKLSSVDPPSASFALTQTGTNPPIPQVSGTPTRAEADASSDVYVYVKGTDPAHDPLSLSYGIAAYDQNDVPYGLPQELPTATAGQTYSATITAIGATSLTTSTTTLGKLTVTSDGATGLKISGIPDPPDNKAHTTGGLYSFEVTATYETAGTPSTYTTTQDFLLDVTPSGPSFALQAANMAPGSNELPAATLGQSYQATLGTSGASASDTYAFWFPAQGQPSWLTIGQDPSSGAWVLGGTPPSTDFAEVANTIIDAVDTTTGVIESRVFQLPINPPSGSPTLTVVNPFGLPQAASTALPLASPGIPFSAQIVASGGTGPLTVSYKVNDNGQGSLAQYNLSIQQSGDTITIAGTPVIPTTYNSINIGVTATDATGATITEWFPLAVNYQPAQIRQAYGINNIILNGGILGDGTGETVAIVVSNDDPNLVSSNDPNFMYSDLYQYDQALGLDRYSNPATAPHFLKLDEFGGTNYPAAGQNNEGEITQDVLWVHAMAPGANIILVETSPNSNASSAMAPFQTAMTYQPAGFPAATVVSNSYGGNENAEPSGVIGDDSFFNTPAAQPVTFVFAMSDPGSGAFVQYSAANRGVLAAAQSYLALNGNGSYGSEQTVSGTGGAPSVYELQPSWQNTIVSQVSTTMRTVTDVSFVGSSYSSPAIIDSYFSTIFGPATGSAGVGESFGAWTNGDGSSLATPSWAALLAIANQARSLVGETALNGPTTTLSELYSLAGTGDFHSITQLNGLDSNQIDKTVLSPVFTNYSALAGLGSPVANLLIPDLAGGQHTISGTVFNDLNGQGSPGEKNPSLAGVTVYLDANNNGQLDPGEASTTTDASGNFSFVVAPGTYTVLAVPPPGDIQSTSNPASITFSPGNTDNSPGVNFGFVSSPSPTPTPTPTPSPTPTPAPAPSPSPTPTPSPTPAPTPSNALPPVLSSVTRLNSALGRKRRHIAFQLTFNMPLSFPLAVNVGNYRVIQSFRFQRPHQRAIPVRSVRYDASTNSVILALGPFHRGRPLTLKIRGLVGADTPVATIVTPL